MFPAVGFIIGIGLFITGRIALLFWSMDAAAAVIILLWTLGTGGLHLDGLSDTMDGLGGGKSREERLAIMKDSRIGSFGALSLVLALLLKYAFLGELEMIGLFPVLVCVPAAARAVLLGGILLFPSARKDGMGVFFRKNLDRRSVLAACSATGFLVLLAAGPAALLVSAAVTAVCFGLCAYAVRLLGGLTGDSYGALCEISEILLLAGFTAFGRWIPFF